VWCEVNSILYMSIKLISVNAAKVATALVLVTSLGLTSCGKKEVAETAGDAAKTAAGAAGDAAKTATGAAGDAAKTAAGAAGDAAKTAGSAMTGGALSVAEKAQLTPVKTALVMANTAVKGGDMAKAKTQFDKFSGLWTAVEPMVKAKAGASYPAIESGLAMVKTAMGSADKAKAGEGLGMAMKALDAVMNKK
jgi:hypothetical protein